MAAFFDILHRLEVTLHLDPRLHVESFYRAQPLPGWLAAPWADAQHNSAAEDLAPILIVNVKGTKPDDAVCLVRLADLERLTREESE